MLARGRFSTSDPSLAKSAALKTRRAQRASPLGSHGHGGHSSSSLSPSCHFLSLDAPLKTMSRRHALPWAFRYVMRRTCRDRNPCLVSGVLASATSELLEMVRADAEVASSMSDVERPSSLAVTLPLLLAVTLPLSEVSLRLCELSLPWHGPVAAKEAATAGGTLGPKHEGLADCEASRRAFVELCRSVAPVSRAVLRRAASLALRLSLVNECEMEGEPRRCTGATRLI